MADTKNTIVEKVNPYIKVGILYKNGIDKIAKELAPTPPDFPKTSEIIEAIVKYLEQNKLTGNDYDYISSDTAYIITARAINNSIEFSSYLGKSRITSYAQIYIMKLYKLIKNLRNGENLYNYEHILKYTDELNDAILKIEREILSSDFSDDDKILPLVSVSIIKESIIFYKAIYDAGGDIVEETNFKNVLQNAIAGTVIGAVEAFSARSSYDSIISGSVAGGIGASLNNSWGQELWITTSPNKLPLKY